LSTAPKNDAGDFANPSLNPCAVQRRKYRIGRSRTGLGLFATKPYRKREYVVTYRGRKLANAEADRLEARGSRYMFEINSRWTIDGSSRWNRARYVNHSCRPNVEAIERKGGKIVYIARRRIKPDEEITVDYGKDYFSAFIGRSRCQCPKCREYRAERQVKYRAKVRRALMRKKPMRKRSRVIDAGPRPRPRTKRTNRPSR
jgi:SET domain-containing protein